MGKFIDYLSRLLMISPVIILGFKLGSVTLAISMLIVGVVLQMISRKIGKN